jgi:hypothetical protein
MKSNVARAIEKVIEELRAAVKYMSKEDYLRVLESLNEDIQMLIEVVNAEMKQENR